MNWKARIKPIDLAQLLVDIAPKLKPEDAEQAAKNLGWMQGTRLGTERTRPVIHGPKPDPYLEIIHRHWTKTNREEKYRAIAADLKEQEINPCDRLDPKARKDIAALNSKRSRTYPPLNEWADMLDCSTRLRDKDPESNPRSGVLRTWRNAYARSKRRR